MCWLTTLSSLSLVTHTMGMTYLKVTIHVLLRSILHIHYVWLHKCKTAKPYHTFMRLEVSRMYKRNHKQVRMIHTNIKHKLHKIWEVIMHTFNMWNCNHRLNLVPQKGYLNLNINCIKQNQQNLKLHSFLSCKLSTFLCLWVNFWI